MHEMFAFTARFYGDLSGWDTSSVMSMHNMFFDSGTKFYTCPDGTTSVSDCDWPLQAAYIARPRAACAGGYTPPPGGGGGGGITVYNNGTVIVRHQARRAAAFTPGRRGEG